MKRCKFDSSKRCWHNSCSLFDAVSGNISVCPLFRGSDMLASRRVGFQLHGIFDKKVFTRKTVA